MNSTNKGDDQAQCIQQIGYLLVEIMAEDWPQQDGVNESPDWPRSRSDTTTGAVMIARD